MANVNDIARMPAESSTSTSWAPRPSSKPRAHGRQYALRPRLHGLGLRSQRPDSEVDESTPLNPDGVSHLYMAEKIASEMLARSYGKLYNFPITVLRYGIPYGPRMREELVMPIFIKKALNGEPLTIAGDGLQYRNFVYVEDLADAHVRVLDQRAPPASSTSKARAKSPSSNSPRPSTAPSLRAPASSARKRAVATTRAASSRASARLTSSAGSPRRSFEEGFDQTLNWFLGKWSEQLAAV